MKTYKSLLLIFTLLLLAGCQAMVYGTATDFGKVSLGMSKAEVISILGDPVSVGGDADKGEETLIYKRMKHAISAWPRTYMIVLRAGKVIRYGEQYQETNVNIF